VTAGRDGPLPIAPFDAISIRSAPPAVAARFRERSELSFTAAIIGRPNVGKSTLFNRLVGRAIALVDDTPGVTRDRREGEARLGPLEFTVVDTAGLEDVPGGNGSPADTGARIREQTERALRAADVGLFMVDARAGITPLDEEFARWLRRGDKPVVLVVNKAEGRSGEMQALDAYTLGLGDPIAISAKHAEGLYELYEVLAPYAEAAVVVPDEEAAEAERPDLLSLAVVGRPNTGKSTLVNRMLGEERMIAGPEAGLTRDAIAVDWTYEGRRIRLVDTAGLRKRARVVDRLEKLATADSLRALRFAQVAVLVIDATVPLERQDLAIASQVAEEGRALVVAANKADLLDDRSAAMKALREQLETSLPQIRGVRFVPLSALTGQGMGKLMPAVLEAHERWNRRVSTGALNRWFTEAVAYHPPPAAAGRRIKLRYITQIKARPPTFVTFASRPGDLPESYRRYLINGIRDAFDLPGVPIRLLIRRGKNPYVES